MNCNFKINKISLIYSLLNNRNNDKFLLNKDKNKKEKKTEEFKKIFEQEMLTGEN